MNKGTVKWFNSQKDSVLSAEKTVKIYLFTSADWQWTDISL